jgi:hypothetical protein
MEALAGLTAGDGQRSRTGVTQTRSERWGCSCTTGIAVSGHVGGKRRAASRGSRAPRARRQPGHDGARSSATRANLSGEQPHPGASRPASVRCGQTPTGRRVRSTCPPVRTNMFGPVRAAPSSVLAVAAHPADSPPDRSVCPAVVTPDSRPGVATRCHPGELRRNEAGSTFATGREAAGNTGQPGVLPEVVTPHGGVADASRARGRTSAVARLRPSQLCCAPAKCQWMRRLCVSAGAG